MMSLALLVTLVRAQEPVAVPGPTGPADAPVTGAEGAVSAPVADSPYRASLEVLVDDRVAERLTAGAEPLAGPAGVGARIGARQQGVAAVALHDDGLPPDSAAGDGIFAGTLQLALAERVTVYVEDGTGVVGELSVFLPSAREAVVRLRTLADPPGLALAQEASAVGGSSTAVTATTATDAGRDRLAHVLWVAICLFAVGFAYMRSVVAQRWSAEVQPLLLRIGRFLDAQERGAPPRTPGSDAPPPSP
jgi:hypothetical protein